jgi:prolyl 4-hydroxylase
MLTMLDPLGWALAIILLLSIQANALCLHSPFGTRTNTFNGGQSKSTKALQIQKDTNVETLSPSSHDSSIASKNESISFWEQKKTNEEIRRHLAKILFPHEDYIRARQHINVISTDLPLITIDNFISAHLCDEIIQAAKASNELKQSTMGLFQNVSSTRTSSTMWLHEKDCEIPLRLLSDKVGGLVGLDASYMENLQVVRYEEGQKFDVHTDHLDSFNDLECKGRLATCLVYLNSSSQGGDKTGFDGGSTYFPEYDTHIIPRQGRAVFWFNTVERPGSSGYSENMVLNVDLRSRHSGSPVYNGEKWVCNRWIHPIPIRNTR